ncbi:MAG: site-specific integrase [Acidithiobacillus sp.]
MRKRGFPSQTRTFRTKRDAESWAKVTESEMLRGVWRNQNEAEKTILTEALNRYAREVSALKKGAVQEISIVGKIKESPLSRMYLASIQGKDIAKYRDAMLSDEYSPITIKRRLSLLSHMFTVATKEWGISGLVNPGIRADSITQAFDRARKRAGIEDLRFHDLRHEATSRLFEKGFNPMEVSAITGHKTLQMLKRYTHLRAEDLAKRMG